LLEGRAVVDLKTCASVEDLKAAIQAAAADGDWIIGEGSYQSYKDSMP
jgi:hypothetical protein